jgi:hypothetical protein
MCGDADAAEQALAAQMEKELVRARRETKWVQGELEHQAEALQRVRRQRARLREQSESLATALAAELSAAYWRDQEAGPRLRRRRDAEAGLVRELEASPHFDAGWYLRQHQAAILEQRVSPALHHVRHANERRLDPSEDFSTVRYLRRHPDAASTGLPAVLHAERHGLVADGLVAVDAREG